jgi:trans-aconitate 2-methyltransferase
MVADHDPASGRVLTDVMGSPASDRSSGMVWDGAHYAEHTAHHRYYDHVLHDRLPTGSTAGLRVLDVGCGAGDFTAGLVEALPGAVIRGVDADPSMIDQARRAHGGTVAFDVCRAQDLLGVVDAGSVDLLVSTACLHWVPRDEHADFLAAAAGVLDPSGRLLVEFGGHGQLADVRGVLDPLAEACGGRAPTWWFPHPDDYAPLLAAAGFVVDECALLTQNRRMDDAEALRGWLTSQVLVGYRPRIPASAWPAFVEGAVSGVTELLRRPDGRCDVEYVRRLVEARAAGPVPA